MSALLSPTTSCRAIDSRFAQRVNLRVFGEDVAEDAEVVQRAALDSELHLACKLDTVFLRVLPFIFQRLGVSAWETVRTMDKQQVVDYYLSLSN